MSMYTVTQTFLLAFIIFAIKSLNKNSLSGSKNGRPIVTESAKTGFICTSNFMSLKSYINSLCE